MMFIFVANLYKCTESIVMCFCTCHGVGGLGKKINAGEKLSIGTDTL